MRWYLYPDLASRERLLGLVVEEKLTVREIAERLGCGKTSVVSALRNHRIARPYVADVPEEVRRKLRMF
ncbi:hypothetical protein [Methanorbis furvi]|uniref:Uncharacterized protein n=1 Tax=Methanorbis furvi TaxID=3028299 RepID=A0AAE4MCR0_9EURY|nr:hypothetical protein [Methanocorpusculaceae archaeon Ag1]